MRIFHVLCVVFLFYVSTDTFADIHVTSGAVSVSDSVMHIRGDITPKLAQEFRVNLTPQIKTILIASRGGYARASLEMAELMLDKNLTLVVDNECASACANLFLAAENKIINPGAYVGWHGGAVNALPYILSVVKQALVSKTEKLPALKLAQLLKSEINFYKRVGVNPDFVYYSGLVSPSIQSKYAKKRNYLIDGKLISTARTMPRKYEFWVPDGAQMEAFGIKNVAPFSYPKEKRAIRTYFGDVSVYMGAAYTYFDAKQLKTKNSLRFNWEKYRELQENVAQLMAIVQEQADSPPFMQSNDSQNKEK